MTMDAVQLLDRRGFLAAAAAMLSVSHQAVAQTFISGTPETDVGFERRQPEVVVSQPMVAATPRLLPSAAVTQQAPAHDWRQHLLTGDRTILVRRDGPARRIRYCTADGLLDRQGYAELCTMLRDVRAGKLYPMDPRLLDILCGLQRWGEFNGRSSVLHLLSGFRTLATNSALEGAALNSMHLYGRAADIFLEGFSSGLLGAMVKQFNPTGGSGIYLNRGFVHVDTGAARSWVSKAPRRR